MTVGVEQLFLTSSRSFKNSAQYTSPVIFFFKEKCISLMHSPSAESWKGQIRVKATFFKWRAVASTPPRSPVVYLQPWNDCVAGLMEQSIPQCSLHIIHTLIFFLCRKWLITSVHGGLSDSKAPVSLETWRFIIIIIFFNVMQDLM